MVVCISKNILNVRPLYFPEKNLIAVAYENTVDVFESQLNIIWKIENENKIINLEYYQDSESKFYISYENGDIKLCDIDTQNIELKIQIKNFVKNVFFYNDDIITVEKDVINLYNQCNINKKKEITKKHFKQIAFGKKTGIIGMIKDLTVIVTGVNDNNKTFFQNVKKRNNNYYLTTITCHPTEPIIATGDTTGRIQIWWDVTTNLKRNTIYHWHFLSLKTLEFNFNGTQLLSGGREQVLVRWEFSQTDEKKKQSCLPRLDADIEQIRSCNSRNGEFYLVTLADNSLRVISSSLYQIIFSYSNLIQRSAFLQNKLLPKSCPLNPIGLKSCFNLPAELNRCVLMNGHEGKLQFYDLNRRITEYQLDVARQNWPTETENYLIPGFIQVQLVTISNCGQFIATVECLGVARTEDECQCSLRIFQWDKPNQKYELESKLHMDNMDKLTDMVFHPCIKDYLMVTTNLMDLILVKRNIENEIPKWNIINSLELEEIVYRFKVNIDIDKKDAPTRLASVENGGNNGLLVVTKCNCVVVYHWSDLLKFNTKPICAVTLATLSEDIDMDNETKKYLQSPIISSAIFKHESLVNCYRVVLGLSTGLIIVEANIKSDSSVDLKTVSSAISKCGVKRLSTFPASFGSNSKVAIIFEESDHLTILSVWNDSNNNTQLISVPLLEDVTWVPVKDRTEWTLIGLLKNNQSRSLVICENEAEKYFSENIIKEIKHEEKNPLKFCEDSLQEKTRKRKRTQEKCLDRGFILYDCKTAPNSKIVFNSTYSKIFVS